MKLISDYNYIGPSMQPLFLPGDGIVIDPEVKFETLVAGDVICYPKPDDDTITVVHRIIGFNSTGEAITRGDNNSECDPYTVTENLKPQLVVKLKRGSKTIKVASGRNGMLVHRKNLIARQFRRKLFPLIRMLCLFFANLRLLYWLKLYDNKLTFKTFKRQQREDEFMILNNHRIGHRTADGLWHIRFPWRFFINPDQVGPEGRYHSKFRNYAAPEMDNPNLSLAFLKYYKLLRLVWYGVIAAVIFFLFYPVNIGIIRLFFVIAIPLIFGGITVQLWDQKKLRWIPIIIMFICFLPFCLPGRAVDKSKLTTTYLNNLKKYEGVRYIWGGENSLGIDCSGLVRKGMINANLSEGFFRANPRCLRKAVELWWFDCSAKALMNNYRDWIKPLFQAESINKLDYRRLEPGDFVVTVDGVHTLVYLGNRQWISADPGVGRVIIETVPVKNNGWFDRPVQILHWQ